MRMTADTTLMANDVLTRWKCPLSIVLAAAVVMMGGCASDHRDYQQAAEQLAATFATTWNAKDGPAYGKAYWPDAELVDPSGHISDGRDAIVKTHQTLWAATGDAKASAVVRRVRPVSPTLMGIDLTVVISGFPAPLPGGTANAKGQVYSNLQHLAERRGTDWKIVASQTTFLPPPP